MHELGIANSVLEAVRSEAQKHPGARVCKVALRIGVLAGVDPGALSFCFEALVKGTEFEPLPLEIEVLPRRHRCPRCGCTFDVADYQVACPDCSAPQTTCVSGDELELAYLEVEAS